MIAILGFGAELAHQNGLLWKSPLHVVSIFGRAAVPADVLVDADDVEGIGEWIVQGGGAAFDVRRVEGGGNEARGIELSGLVDEIDEELGAIGIVGSLVGDGPEVLLAAVLISAGFFFSVLPSNTTQANGAFSLIYLGAVALAVAVISLGIGLLKSCVVHALKANT